MKASFLVSLVAWCVFTVHSTNTSVVEFYPRDEGLVWPLPDPGYPVAVFEHALHCKQVMKAGRNISDTEKMYTQHCQQVTESVEELMRSATLDTSPSACKALSGQQYQLQGYTYYDAFTRPVWNSTSTLVKLAGYNFGQVLMKEYYNDPKDPLTVKERKYLDSWFNPETMHQSAIAYLCQELYETEDEPDYKSPGKEQTSSYTGYWQIGAIGWCPSCKCPLTASGSAPTETTIQLEVKESSCESAPRCICQGVSGTLLGIVSNSQFSGHYITASCSGPVQPDQILLNCNTPNPSIMAFNLE